MDWSGLTVTASSSGNVNYSNQGWVLFYVTLTAVVAGVAYWELRGRADDVDRARGGSGLLTLAAGAVVVTIAGVLWLLR